MQRRILGIRLNYGPGAIMSRSKHSERNLAIFIAYSLGETVGSLSEKHGLSPNSLYAIILAESIAALSAPLAIYREA
jgi:Mor family transcriptional regulator